MHLPPDASVQQMRQALLSALSQLETMSDEHPIPAQQDYQVWDDLYLLIDGVAGELRRQRFDTYRKDQEAARERQLRK